MFYFNSLQEIKIYWVTRLFLLVIIIRDTTLKNKMQSLLHKTLNKIEKEKKDNDKNLHRFIRQTAQLKVSRIFVILKTKNIGITRANNSCTFIKNHRTGFQI